VVETNVLVVKEFWFFCAHIKSLLPFPCDEWTKLLP